MNRNIIVESFMHNSASFITDICQISSETMFYDSVIRIGVAFYLDGSGDLAGRCTSLDLLYIDEANDLNISVASITIPARAPDMTDSEYINAMLAEFNRSLDSADEVNNNAYQNSHLEEIIY